MEYAVDYIESDQCRNQALNKLNKVRKFKCIFLPFKLVGMNGHQVTNAFYNNEEPSSILYKSIRQD